MSHRRPAWIFRLSPRTARWGLILSVFVAVWSVKLMTIARYGTDLPYWDQWAKEGELFYAPWFERHEFWKPAFLPHNEHRIAPTLALNLGLLRLGGDQWDARVQCAASAALHALIAAALAAWALRRRSPAEAGPTPSQAGPASADLRSRWVLATTLVIVLVAAPPIAWENVLGGFQSVFYFLTLFSLFALWAMLRARPFSWLWLAGLASAAAACVSMGSGMLVGVPIAAVAGLRVIQSDQRRAAVVTLLSAIALGSVGWWLRPQAPWHEVIHAHSLRDSLLYAARCLAWPLYDSPWLAPVFWAPWAVLVWRHVRGTLGARASRPHSDSCAGGTPALAVRPKQADAFILGGGLWVLVQAAAVSHSRAGASPFPAPRYGDIFALGLVFNFFAFACLATRHPATQPGETSHRPSRIRFAGSLAVVWVLILAASVALATRAAIAGPLPAKKADALAYERNVQAFVLTDDYAAFAAEAGHLPFPAPEWLAKILRNPTLRRLLPASVRQPLPLAAEAGSMGRETPDAALPHRAVWALATGATWRSQPLPATGGWWKIETTGDVGTPGATLELASLDGHVLATIRPTKLDRAAWRAAYVRAPSEPAVLVARVAPPASSLAFSAPVVVSSLSFWTWRFCEHAGWLAAVAGVGLLVFASSVLRASESPTEKERGLQPASVVERGSPPEAG